MPNPDGTPTKEERHESGLNRGLNWLGVAMCIGGIFLWPLLVLGLFTVIFIPAYDDASHDYLQTTEPGSPLGLLPILGYVAIIVIVFVFGAAVTAGP